MSKIMAGVKIYAIPVVVISVIILGLVLHAFKVVDGAYALMLALLILIVDLVYHGVKGMYKREVK